jgi:PhoPQ-activated pathogenicity-related protein
MIGHATGDSIMKWLVRSLFVLLSLGCGIAAARHETALDRYVAAPDSNYKWELVSTIPGEGYTAYVIDMTSQQWRNATEVDRPLWHHWVTIIKPDNVKYSTGFLFITGGANGGKAPAQADASLRNFAVESNSVVTELRMVPNQPLIFAGETKGRSEDGIIAYTWDKFLRGGDENWPLRLPMTKAAVRAMDTVTAFCASDKGGKVDVGKFVVAGGSKRGWTTWTTAAVDKRVVAIIPTSIDLLNIEKSFQHHFQAYGFWAPAVGDYERMGIMKWTGHPRYQELMEIEEPYNYRDRLTLPKLIINASGDQFFLPDSSQFYFEGLKGEKHLRYVPNASHNLAGSDVRETMLAFYEAVLDNRKRPELTFRDEKDGGIRMSTKDKPIEVKMWAATNMEARDFRLEKIGPAYKATVLAESRKGVYIGKVEKPEKGWTAFFIEASFPSGGKYPLKFTSGVRVIPDLLPFPPPAKVDDPTK